MPRRQDPICCIIVTFFLGTNQNHFNNFSRGPEIIPVEFGQIFKSGSREEIVWGSSFPYKIQCNIWHQGYNLNNFGRGPLDRWCYMPNMKSLGRVAQDKKIIEKCFFLNLFFDHLTSCPTYATDQNHLNNFGSGLPRDHSCWVQFENLLFDPVTNLCNQSEHFEQFW